MSTLTVEETRKAPLDIVEFCMANLYGRHCHFDRQDNCVVWLNATGGLSHAEYLRHLNAGASEVSL